MKREHIIWLRCVTPYSWATAILFFLIAEFLILAAEIHGLEGFSIARRLSLPVILIGPLTAGFIFARLIKRHSGSTACFEVTVLASASNALMVCLLYALVTGILTFLL